MFSAYAVGAVNNSRRTLSRSRFSPLLAVITLLAVIVVGLRYRVGGDWDNYIAIFEATPRYLSELSEAGDVGYIFLNWVALQLNLDVWFVNLICAIILFAALVRFAIGEPNPWLTLLVAAPYLVLVVGMGYTRQSVAIALTIMVILEMRSSKYVRASIFFLLALMFHRTAIIVLPLVALSTVRHRLFIWAMALAGGITAFLFLFEQMLSLLVISYLDSGMSSEGAGVRIAMNVLPALVFLTWGKKFVYSLEEFQLWRNYSIAALAAAAALLVISSSTVVDRLALYLAPLQLMVWGRLPYALSGNRGPGPLVLLVIAYSAAVQFIWLNYASHSHAWIPYRIFYPSQLW
jgi:hypothetical protein